MSSKEEAGTRVGPTANRQGAVTLRGFASPRPTRLDGNSKIRIGVVTR